MPVGLDSVDEESLDLAGQEDRSGSSIRKSEHSPSLRYINEEEEDEDADFNPFIKNNSAEASSSLSSEVEDLDINETDSTGKNAVARGENYEKKYAFDVRDRSIGGNFNISDIVVQASVSPGDADGKRIGENSVATAEEPRPLISQSENVSISNESTGNVHQIDSTCVTADGKTVADADCDTAICMRTRARYSLASFTLDELETFLQETDDEDDLHKVDDEEEYRKFLAAVLRGDESVNAPENCNGDDEDEENDADFELELEEALESEPEDVEKRRLTRLNKRRKTSVDHSNKVSQHAGRRLRPLIPLSSLGSFSSSEGNLLAPNIPQPFAPPVNTSFCGFTPHQIGQLHCLIHEHVQLLIQVFSICVSEPVKSHIAAEVKDLMLEMLRIRDQALTWKKAPYPNVCFLSPHVHSSVADEGPKMFPPNCSFRNSIQNTIGSNKDVPSDFSSMSHEKFARLPDEQNGCSRTPELTSWAPHISGPVLSVLDVAPLKLVENYVEDVTSVVRTYERSQIELGFESQCQPEHLFPFQSSPGCAESDSQGEIENNFSDPNELHSSLSGNEIPKKTMAAALLEKAKSQPIYLVPKDIAKLAQIFRPLFNPALYPHKPPPAPLANRILFTDAEDELLALGLMEFNTDWKAIQQRFLPCKSTHQIFVRQKNRASSKAPENPIKAVRRMKNSPLTSDEISRIEVGLKKFKLDWISVWRFLIPYRDPSLLPRQWRIASGTQKSYKSDANKKAKRHLYELRRKSSKSSPSFLRSPSEKEAYITDNAKRWSKDIDKEDEAYVHEAFLADWRPDSNISSILHSALHSEESFQARARIDNSGSGVNQSQIYPSTSSTQVYLRPYRARRPNSAQVVKLAPDLPPVNLPPSVRIISNSAFKRDQPAGYAKISGNVSRVACGMTDGKDTSQKTAQPASDAALRRPSDSDVMFENIPELSDSDLQMHPLLFQPSQDLPNSSGLHNSFTSIAGKQPQLALSLFHNPCQIKDAVSFLSKPSKSPEKCASSSGAVFHPLLQRNYAVNTEAIVLRPPARVTCAESRQRHALASKQVSGKFSGSSAPGTKVITPDSRNNNLDLDIHLSVTSEIVEDRVTTMRCLSRPSTAQESGPSEAAQKGRALDGISRDNNRGDFDLVTDRKRPCTDLHDMRDDESFPEIIMEQEELSDSDEELEENIEFECEEMADSEADSTSDSEQHTK